MARLIPFGIGVGIGIGIEKALFVTIDSDIDPDGTIVRLCRQL
jgi:hypothetical protein